MAKLINVYLKALEIFDLFTYNKLNTTIMNKNELLEIIIDIWTETSDYMSSVELSKIIKYVEVVDRHWLIGMHDYLETVVLHIY